MGQALGLQTRFTDITPAKRILFVRWPNGVLLFVIDYDFIYGLVLIHNSVPLVGIAD
jgi:hypothetical protein